MDINLLYFKPQGSSPLRDYPSKFHLDKYYGEVHKYGHDCLKVFVVDLTRLSAATWISCT